MAKGGKKSGGEKKPLNLKVGAGGGQGRLAKIKAYGGKKGK